MNTLEQITEPAQTPETTPDVAEQQLQQNKIQNQLQPNQLQNQLHQVGSNTQMAQQVQSHPMQNTQMNQPQHVQPNQMGQQVGPSQQGQNPQMGQNQHMGANQQMMMRMGNGVMNPNMYYYQMQMYQNQQGQKGMPMNMQMGMSRFMPQYNAYLNRVQPMQQMAPTHPMMQQQMGHNQQVQSAMMMQQQQQQQQQGETKTEETGETKQQPMSNMPPNMYPNMMGNPMNPVGMPMMHPGGMGGMYYGPRLLVNNAIDSIPSLRLANSQFQNVTQVLDALATQSKKRRAPRASREPREDSDFKNVLQDYFSASDNSDDEFLVSRSLRLNDGSSSIRRSNRTRTKTAKYDEYNETESDTQEDYIANYQPTTVNNINPTGVKSNRGRKKGVSYKKPTPAKPVNPYSRSNYLQFDESSDESPQFSGHDYDPNSIESSGLSLRHRKHKVNYAELEYSEEEEVVEGEEEEKKSSGGIDRVINHRQREDGEWEYLIKWQGFAHIHNTWDVYENLKEYNGIRRLDNYIKRFKNLEERQKYMTLDEIEQENIALGLQKQIDEDSLIAERIVTHYKDENGVMVYLVKWRSCPYDQCTEEDEETLVEHGFQDLIDAYKIREDRILGEAARKIPWNTHSISLTKFEPYYETPKYLSNPTYLEDLGYTSRLYYTILAARANRLKTDGVNEAGEVKADAVKPQDSVKGEVTNLVKEQEPMVNNETDVKINGVKEEKNEQEDVKMDLDQETNSTTSAQSFPNSVKSEPNAQQSVNTGSTENSVNSAQQGDAGVKKYHLRDNVPNSIYKVSEPRKLRDYQLTGLNWMVNRMKRGLSVLLADEMGLGKTVQTISLVGHFMYKEFLIGPYLIIVPQSTIDNWMREFEAWLPQANAVCYYGNATAREMIRQRELTRIFVPGKGERYKCDVCITTPSIINSPADLDFLRRISWQLMVVDEAHQLKNKNSKRFVELMQFMADYKLLLSGTPLHNNLEELWTLLHFINPQIYPYYEDFRRRYSEIENPAAIGENKQKQLLSLQHELHEFVLRRVKKDVEKSLPNKVERILRVELSPMQIEWYKNILARNYEELARNSGGSRSSLQNICMELKKVCNHPFLCYEPEDRQVWLQGLIYGSGKICLLDKLLQRLKEKGHRVLIFSQMVRMLNIISEYLTLRGFKHQRLDGTMGKEVRKKAMDHFNDPQSDDFCFLLSTKAGGLGINLTSADTVIIYDSDWNPQNDLQAEARAHRIGQTKTVQIYRLVTKDSIEQTILERAKTKMVLDALVVQGLNKRGDAVMFNDDGKSGFSREELAKILKFGASKLWATANPQTNKTSSTDEKLDIDLDKVLQEAELTKENDSDLAADLLSSYTNITEFRYEPPEGQLEATGENDKEFWEATIPLEERVKLKKKKQEELLVMGPRRTRAKDTGTIETDDYSDDEADADFQPRKTTKELLQSQEGIKGKRGQRRSRKAVLTIKDKMKIHRSLSKFGVPELRLKDIHADTKLNKVDPRVILNECQNMIDTCKSKLKSNADDEDRRSRRSQLIVEMGEIKVNAQDFLDKMKLLESLEQFGRKLAGSSWNMAPNDEFEIPQQVLDQMNEGKETWTSDDIVNLLKLINKLGFGYWSQMCADKELCVGVLQDIKHDKLKNRAMKLLKIVNTYIDPSSVITLSDEKRLSTVRETPVKVKKKESVTSDKENDLTPSEGPNDKVRDDLSDIYTLDPSDASKDVIDVANLLSTGKLTSRDHYASAVKHVLKSCRDVLRTTKRLRNPSLDFTENLKSEEFQTQVRDTVKMVKNALDSNLNVCPDEVVANKLRTACWKFVSKIIQSDQFHLESY
ncbi:SNF2-family protein (chromodomain-helicase-DNA-binding protein 1) [Theileria annulata]|uniref:SNF2-family protein (Chromodomain-helicase-DNA-binding protein 1 homologue), putative n=1 Tax=Theileria annulata TaxID=5874 RepID=Q4UI59_THEAN|nr:SNF2-family protein (chromodomain-helicase-DNA-binding protein 1) [Theileria annulata]CAI73230.1 SNF2-family protein (chromodomain-helicase-DNA-binding protein 1 homologue), putative [Theileria annulata]|eukprot:XP_953907.1 SNF2-family protein (chromodomain-helicase-DNA-binding protein 1 homologue), putative [Theileria annulata]